MFENIEKQIYKFNEQYSIIDILNNIESIKSFLGIKETYQERVEKNIEKYASSLEAYDMIINSTVKLCRELNLEDSLSIFAVFDYLLWNGYFSKNKEYIYSIGGRKNLCGYYGTDIINGQGVCLNKAHMLEKILKSMDYDSHIIINSVFEKIELDYKPNIEREIKIDYQFQMKKMIFKLNPLIKLIGNHACTLVKKDDVYYIYDPTNLWVFKLDRFLQANIVGGTGNIVINPYYFSKYCGLDNKKIIEIVGSHKSVSTEKNPYDLDIIKSTFETNIDLCQNNKGLLNDFYIENESNREKVLEIYNKKNI